MGSPAALLQGHDSLNIRGTRAPGTLTPRPPADEVGGVGMSGCAEARELFPGLGLTAGLPQPGPWEGLRERNGGSRAGQEELLAGPGSQTSRSTAMGSPPGHRPQPTDRPTDRPSWGQRRWEGLTQVASDDNSKDNVNIWRKCREPAEGPQRRSQGPGRQQQRRAPVTGWALMAAVTGAPLCGLSSNPPQFGCRKRARQVPGEDMPRHVLRRRGGRRHGRGHGAGCPTPTCGG